eukprot:292419-Pyramimonas_sp.AAC.1
MLCQPPTHIAQHVGSRTQFFYRAARIAGASDQTIDDIEEFEVELKDELEAANKFFAKQAREDWSAWLHVGVSSGSRR